MGEHDAECEHGAEVVDETGRQNDLAEFSLIEAGFNHHSIDDCDRGR